MIEATYGIINETKNDEKATNDEESKNDIYFLIETCIHQNLYDKTNKWLR